MRVKMWAVFAAALFINILIVPDVYSQQAISHFALEHFKRSVEYLMVGDYQNALLASNQLIRSDPHSAINYVIRARALFEMADFERVITDCTQAIRLDRNNSAAYVIRGNAHAQRGALSRAISDWEAALRINPNIAEARQNIELARQQN